MEQHTHGPDGLVIIASEPDAAEVVEAVADAEATETVADASVEIARIEANRDVTIAKLAAKAEDAEEQSELDQLRGEVRALRELVDRIAPPEPEPTPAPVVVEAPPAVEEPTVPEPPAVENKPSRKKSSSVSWF